ncbi:MAG: nucleotide exchange factor GrpE [Candidatus Gastranaerophilaceae bacterium]
MKHKHKKEEGNNPFKTEDAKVPGCKDTEKNGEENLSTVQPLDLSTKLQEDFDNLNNQYLRLAADFDNYRKRQAQERETLIRYGAEDAMRKLIEVLDNFDRAKQSIDGTDDVNQVKESFNVLYNQLFDNLSKLGLEVIDSQGKEFDPNFHEAVMQTPTGEHPENHVIMELQKGYKFGDKVLRPALVNVATNE